MNFSRITHNLFFNGKLTGDWTKDRLDILYLSASTIGPYRSKGRANTIRNILLMSRAMYLHYDDHNVVYAEIEDYCVGKQKITLSFFKDYDLRFKVGAIFKDSGECHPTSTLIEKRD